LAREVWGSALGKSQSKVPITDWNLTGIFSGWVAVEGTTIVVPGKKQFYISLWRAPGTKTPTGRDAHLSVLNESPSKLTAMKKLFRAILGTNTALRHDTDLIMFSKGS